MEFKFEKLTKEEISDLLSGFNDVFLQIPMLNNAKHFQQKANGFRMGYFPVTIIHKIYYEDISLPKSLLRDYLSFVINNFLDELEITRIIEDKQLDETSKAINIYFKLNMNVESRIKNKDYVSIYQKSFKSNRSIDIKLLYKLLGVELDEISNKLLEIISFEFKQYTEIVEKNKEEYFNQQKEENNLLNDKIINLKHYHSEELKKCEDHTKELVKDLNKVRNECEKLENKTKEDNKLFNEYKLTQEKINEYKSNMETYKANFDRLTNDLKNKERELSSMEKDVNELIEKKMKVEAILEENNALVEKLNKEKEAIFEDLNKKEEIANQINFNIRAKLNDTSENIANFFSQYAMFSVPKQIQNIDIKKTSQNKIICGKNIDESPFCIENKEDLIESLAYNIVNSGVSSDLSEVVAAYLIAAYTLKIPLILAGPNSVEIANALSASLKNRTADIFYADDDITLDSLEENENITMVFGTFNSSNMDKILPFGLKTNRFFIYVLSTSEELLIETKGIFNYGLPLFTELFVEKRPEYVFEGSIYNEPIDIDLNSKVNLLISKRNISKLTYGFCKDILSCYKNIRKKADQKEELILQTIPVMLVLEKQEELKNIIDSIDLNENEKVMIEELVGEK